MSKCRPESRPGSTFPGCHDLTYRTYSLNLEFSPHEMGLASFADLDCERASAVDLWRRIAWFGDPAEGVKLG